VFAKLGIASTTSEATGFSSTSKSDLTYGIGGQFNVNKQVGIRLGYDVYKLSDSVVTVDQKNTSIGVVVQILIKLERRKKPDWFRLFCLLAGLQSRLGPPSVLVPLWNIQSRTV